MWTGYINIYIYIYWIFELAEYLCKMTITDHQLKCCEMLLELLISDANIISVHILGLNGPGDPQR